MKLKNRKTGEIGELHFEPDKEYHFTVVTEDPADLMIFKTLAELNEEWGDYEEPEEYWYICTAGSSQAEKVTINEFTDLEAVEFDKQIGNYFETREEAEKAVEKLKAWKRLKDKGFRFKGYTDNSGDLFSCQVIRCSFNYSGNYTESRKDLNLLFGGEE